MITKEKIITQNHNLKFGTGGFRGVIGVDFTKENIQMICQSVANIINRENLKKEIFVGYDNRFMSEQFAEFCCEVFVANGIDVSLNMSACTTPIVMYETMVGKNDYGVMLTASHNPHIYNGIKIFTKDGRDASIEDTLKIEKEFENLTSLKFVDLEDCKKQIKYVDYIEEFVDYIINNQQIPNCNDIKAVFDTKHGSSAQEIKLFCKKVGLNYKILNEKRDAFFDFALPAPNWDNVEDLKKEVVENNYNIGFALDSDGDRLAVIDENGKFIDNNIILAIVYYYLNKFQNKRGGIVKSVATSSILDILASKLGENCYEVPIGFKYTSSKLIETGAVVGGESSGGLALQNHIWGKDSLVSIALCLKILKFFNKPFSEIVEEVLNFANGYNKVFVEKQYKYSLEKKDFLKDLLLNKKILPKLTYPISKIVMKDYVKVYYTNNNWALIRFSGTEPVLRIFVENDTVDKTKQEIELWEKFLELD